MLKSLSLWSFYLQNPTLVLNRKQLPVHAKNKSLKDFVSVNKRIKRLQWWNFQGKVFPFFSKHEQKHSGRKFYLWDLLMGGKKKIVKTWETNKHPFHIWDMQYNICQPHLHLFFVLSADVRELNKPFDVIYFVLLHSLSINHTSVTVLVLQERLDTTRQQNIFIRKLRRLQMKIIQSKSRWAKNQINKTPLIIHSNRCFLSNQCTWEGLFTFIHTKSILDFHPCYPFLPVRTSSPDYNQATSITMHARIKLLWITILCSECHIMVGTR